MSNFNFELIFNQCGRSETKIEYEIHLIGSMTDLVIDIVNVEISNIEKVSQAFSSKIDDRQKLQALGEELFTMFFTEKIRAALYNSLKILFVDELGKSDLRVRLQFTNTPELLLLPWECLYISEFKEFLVLLPRTSMFRLVHTKYRNSIPNSIVPVRILVILSSLPEFGYIDLEQEWKQITKALESRVNLGVVELELLRRPTVSALKKTLHEKNYHILHFSGLGGFEEPQGYIILEDEKGEPQFLYGENLADILKHYETLQLAFLNCSNGARISLKDSSKSMAQSLLQIGTHAVLGMQSAISDKTAANLAYEFYASLADGFSIDQALARFRQVNLGQDGIEWVVPTLYSLLPPNNYIFGPIWQPNSAELEVRKVENCYDLNAIYNVHQILSNINVLGELTQSLLRIFHNLSSGASLSFHQQSNFNQRLVFNDIGNRLDELKANLAENHTRYGMRFHRIATQWVKITDTYLNSLAESAKLQQEIDNPYIIGVSLTLEQTIFVGRTDVATRLEQLLLDRRQPPLLLYGQRRIGKTSLLNNLGRLLPSTLVPMFVDLQGAPSHASDFAGLLYNVAREMTKSAEERRSLTLPTLTRDALGADPFTTFDEWLDAVERTLGDNTALLMLDEFEALDRALERERYQEEEVLGMLRHLIQHRPKFKVLLAGSHTLAEYQRWSSYLINVQTIHISYLKEDEARQLIERPVKEFTLRYESDASQRVIALTRCHPYLVQLLCRELIALKNEQDPNVRRLAALVDVESAVPEALAHGSMFFSDIERNQVDEMGRTVLRVLAAQGEGGVISQAQLAQVCPENLTGTLKQLQQRELIEPTEGGYRFQVELIRRWFAQ